MRQLILLLIFQLSESVSNHLSLLYKHCHQTLAGHITIYYETLNSIRYSQYWGHYETLFHFLKTLLTNIHPFKFHILASEYSP